jgi:hypothetical protein
MSMGMGQMEHMRAVSPEACPSPPLALSLPPKAPKNVNKNGGESRRPGRPRKNPLKLPKSRSPSPTKTRTSNRKKKAPPAKSPPQTTPEQRQDMQEEEDEQEEEEQEPYMVEVRPHAETHQHGRQPCSAMRVADCHELSFSQRGHISTHTHHGYPT